MSEALSPDGEAGNRIPSECTNEGRPVAVGTAVTCLGSYRPTGKPGERQCRDDETEGWKREAEPSWGFRCGCNNTDLSSGH